MSTPLGSPRFLSDLVAFGDRIAFIQGDRRVTYAELAAAVDRYAEHLGAGRRLVLLSGGNDLSTLVAYLATVAHGHVALLSDCRQAPGLEQTYRPDVVVRDGVVVRSAPQPRHDLHPELALLLSTSGSTGSPKLVRLSHENLRSNAASIAQYLELTERDRAITTLPLHYCYGLSVIHSHLSRGASIVLSDLSVVDDAFLDVVQEREVTSFAGVPYTFDLLARTAFADRSLPSLRYLTQAGGRLAPDRVADLADLCRTKQIDLFVMYGATEATARMAWLPPDQVRRAPDAIGVAVPGGSLSLAPVPELADATGEAVGELVYQGPNVMLGYAESPADLARGREVTELRTGDLARQGEDGLFRIVGRRSRIAKILGLRIDLDVAERTLDAEGFPARCADGGDHLVLAIPGPLAASSPARLRQIALSRWGLPASTIRIVEVAELPRLSNDKVDYRALAALATEDESASPGPDPDAGDLRGRLRDAYAVVLNRPVSDADSFIDLGGDSLSYVEASVRVEAILGSLPAAWPRLPVARLADLAGPDDAELATAHRGRWRQVETSIVLRALAIVAIVGSHSNLFALLGGAHLLLGVSGFNYARFQPRGDLATRVRGHLTAVARIAVPAVLWIGAVTVLTGTYPWRTVFLVNGLVSRGWSEPAWHYWFIEAIVALLLVLTALTCVPAWRRWELRWPFWLPFTLACGALVTRYEWWEPRGGDDIHRMHMLLWIFAIGAATARAEHRWQRLLVSALIVAVVPGFFHDPGRELFLAAGLLALVWLEQLRLPRLPATILTSLATASLYIYLTHWQVYPRWEDEAPLLALVASLAVGVGVATVTERAQRRVRTAISRRRTPLTAPPAGRREPSAP